MLVSCTIIGMANLLAGTVARGGSKNRIGRDAFAGVRWQSGEFATTARLRSNEILCDSLSNVICPFYNTLRDNYDSPYCTKLKNCLCRGSQVRTLARAVAIGGQGFDLRGGAGRWGVGA
eukprot:1178317-Prorocentrum_minimum.AAC.5